MAKMTTEEDGKKTVWDYGNGTRKQAPPDVNSDGLKGGSLKPLQYLSLLIAIVGGVIGGVVYVTNQISSSEVKIAFLTDQEKKLVGSVDVIKENLKSLDVKSDYMSQQIADLRAFMLQGERRTKREGDKADSKIAFLEEQMRKLPPEWFRENFETLKGEVKIINDHLIELSSGMKLLRHSIDHFDSNVKVNEPSGP